MDKTGTGGQLMLSGAVDMSTPFTALMYAIHSILPCHHRSPATPLYASRL
ncbi:hypothetical protein [Buttiauxella sp. B2]|nr:hypothetical protein [Buttiauxella sp. B2]